MRRSLESARASELPCGTVYFWHRRTHEPMCAINANTDHRGLCMMRCTSANIVNKKEVQQVWRAALAALESVAGQALHFN